MAAKRPTKSRFNLRDYTIEPVIFLSMYFNFTNKLSYQALIYEKVCVSSYNRTVCDNLSNATFKQAELDVQKTTSSWFFYLNLEGSIASFLVILLFFGPLGDKVGKKITIIIPVVGSLVYSTSNLFSAIYIEAPLEYLMVGELLNGVLGGQIAGMASTFSYISHISTPESRTVRMGLAEGVLFLAATIGQFASGFMLDRTSFTFVFSFLVGLSILILVYIVVVVKNVLPEKRLDAKEDESGRCKRFLLESVLAIAGCVYRKRRHENFKKLCLLLFVFFFIQLANAGETDIMLIFTRHPPLSWSQTTLGIFKSAQFFLMGLGVFIGLPVLKRVFHARDTTIAMIGFVSKALPHFVLGFATNTTVLFISAILGAMQGFSGAGIRSMCSRMVDFNEQARMFSLIGVFDGLSQLAAGSLFNNLYNATLTFLPGFPFLVMGVTLVACTFLIAYLHCQLAGEDSTTDKDPEADVEVTIKHVPEDSSPVSQTRM